ncbi:MAG: hypothetical protein COV29_01955 [Candidatus Yanofskybacteria bacterium CG10_big_fil_rev_8_21_14_0_10_36_16]|uniref:Uncharacterized protein n=1 Tax=Candidatus Yanofskybacteria bacterium CG10_big_fil_rev_8_21_14_0_10_36_16 TaxID=1975096 RepID=A0A2J0Q7F7_9BACT|nr:MAG: hypothetical protein COV29_01955 [Candidatus Yanofskybacteria bacterium CG10_big_fil_rev_8_21_14_0_10_36_16]
MITLFVLCGAFAFALAAVFPFPFMLFFGFISLTTDHTEGKMLSFVIASCFAVVFFVTLVYLTLLLLFVPLS